VLDVVCHHGEHGGDKKPPEVAMLQRRKSDLLSRARCSF
jgi:hypothetical protein